MLRVAVIGADAADWNVVSARARHASLERCDAPAPVDQVWLSAEAVACVGNVRVDDPLIVAALTANKHVLLALPSVPGVSDLARWCDLAQKHRVRLDVVNPQLARPSRRLIRQQIENGKLGEVGLVRISRSVSPRATGAASLSRVILADIDLSMWLIGRAPDRVFAIRRRVETGGETTGECLHVHLGFPQGGSALVMATSAGPGGDESESLSVIARSGAAYADDHQNRQLLFGGGTATAVHADEGAAVALLLDEFAMRVSGSSDPAPDLLRWRQRATIAAAMDKSIESQQAIALEFN